MLDALSAPFPTLKFMPTGGIGMQNLGSYIRKPYITACGGSWMVKAELITQGKWDEISRLSREAVNAVHGFSFAHLGVSEDSVGTCMAASTEFGHLLQPYQRATAACSPAISSRSRSPPPVERKVISASGLGISSGL